MLNKAQAKSRLIWLLLSFLVIVLDQASKLWVSTQLHLHETIPVLPFFNISLWHNTGAAFSFLGSASGWQRWFFIALGLIVSVIIVVMLSRRSRYPWTKCSGLALILGGAVGNVWDRLSHGYVIDFLLFYVKEWQWPVFNLADTAISLGVILLFFSFLGTDDN